MCAIFGTKNYTKFIDLYKINRDRGGFAFSVVFCNKNAVKPILKYITWVTQYNKLLFNKSNINDTYYLGHHQAPTSSVRKFHTETSHPFECGDWCVSHNGVLTNHRELLPDHNCEVDSSYIPALLNNETSDEVTAITNVFNVLKGTFACWILNKKTDNIYLVKQGSTIFYNKSDFSSVEFDGSKPLKDGVVYKVEDQCINNVGAFVDKNPFLLI